MEHILYLDLETYSSIPIKNGAYKYAEKAEILLFAYALDDGPVHVWDCKSHKIPKELQNLLGRKDTLWCAHNSQFDRTMLEKLLGVKYKFWIDTMTIAFQHSLPGKLEDLCNTFQLPVNEAKDKRGKSLIQLFCKPLGRNRKLKRATKETHPKEWEEFIEYAKSDIKSMRELYKKMPKWNFTKFEYNIWQLDQKINERGIHLDIDLAKKVINAVEVKKTNDKSLIFELTNGFVSSATQIDKLLKFIKNNYGIYMPDLTATTVIYFLENEKLPKIVSKLLKIRQNSSKTSTKKYQTAIDAVGYDNRIRCTLQFCGANRTGRWGGRIIQPQNFPRPKYKNKEISVAIENLKTDKPVGDIVRMASSMLRGLITADKGKKLVVSDYASIEGRVLAWLAGDGKKIKAYESVDKSEGYDMYITAYANSFNIDPKNVTPEQRQIGKPIELAFGYAGGFCAFDRIAKSYNMDLNNIAERVTLPEDIYLQAEKYYTYLLDTNPPAYSANTFIMIDGIKRLWRLANPCTTQLWSDVQNAVIYAINGCKSVAGMCVFDTKKNWLRIQLPSGRYLCYPNIKYVNKTISYYGRIEKSKKYGNITSYGGKFVENITQAVARDILTVGMLNAERKGYKIILTVHDELVTEVCDNKQYTHKKLSEYMSVLPPWAIGLPLNAEGFETYRYRKD